MLKGNLKLVSGHMFTCERGLNTVPYLWNKPTSQQVSDLPYIIFIICYINTNWPEVKIFSKPLLYLKAVKVKSEWMLIGC